VAKKALPVILATTLRISANIPSDFNVFKYTPMFDFLMLLRPWIRWPFAVVVSDPRVVTAGPQERLDQRSKLQPPQPGS